MSKRRFRYAAWRRASDFMVTAEGRVPLAPLTFPARLKGQGHHPWFPLAPNLWHFGYHPSPPLSPFALHLGRRSYRMAVVAFIASIRRIIRANV